MRYAEVAVDYDVNMTFHYHIPEKLDDVLQPGHLVRVSFRTAMQPAIVIGIDDDLPPDLQDITTKPILDLLDPDPVMTPEHIMLGLWLSDTYLTAPGACLWLMLPPGLTGTSQRTVHLADDTADPDTPMKSAIVNVLRDQGSTRINQLSSLTGYRTAATAARELANEGVLRIEARLNPPRVSPKTVRTVQRAIPEEDVDDTLEQQLSRAPKQQRVFSHIARFEYPLDVPDVYEATGATSTDLNNLAEKGLVTLDERIIYRDSLADSAFVLSEPPPLTAGQAAVWQVIHPALRGETGSTGDPTPHKFLLHGVTGSGKTEIYSRAIADTLQQGRQAIFLVPEIALTPQTIRRVAQRFPDKVAVVHGSLSRGERYDTWRRARNGEIPVIVGTRSALFTPLPDCGLIVLDEEHDSSYKQTPPLHPPYYHARAVAEKMVALNNGTLILGSATPDLDTRYRALKGDLTYLHLPDRIMGHRRRLRELAQQQNIAVRYQPAEGEAMTMELPPVLVVDMRDELKAGNTSMFSRDLQAALEGVLARGEQAMLLLNRRGQSTYVFCRDCGYVVECDNCDTPLTYHRQGEAMRCHHCGFQKPAPEICPVCDSKRIRYFGAGTQQVERAVQKHFPQAKTVRWDADTASRADLHEKILGRFMAGEANVMIGTQMIAKGLDLPLVTLVGVVSADPGLAMPDFRADERAFQLLTQVAGRAGRGVLGGEVIVQTYQPQHRAIVAAAQHDYEAFYDDEIEVRRRMGYPPFRRLARVLIQNTHPIEAERRAEDIAQHLRQRINALEMHDTHLIGPAPCFFSRIDRFYRWQVLVRSSDPLPVLTELQLVSRPDKGQTEYLDIDTLDIL